MTDNGLIQLFLPLINAGLIANGINNVTLAAFNQPTQQGVSDSPTVYFSKIMDKLYGQMGRKTEYNTTSNEMIHIESQFYETVFQFQALVPFSFDPAVLTTSDVLNTVLHTVQSDSFIEAVNSNNVQVLRISEVRNTYFVNDEGRHQPIPSFDISFMHERKYVTTSPIATRVELDIYEV